MEEKVISGLSGLKKSVIICLLGLAGFIASVLVQNYSTVISTQSPLIDLSNRLKYWSICLNNWNENGNLRTMDRVFDRLDYVAVNGSDGQEWDVLWSIEYPFPVNKKASKLFDNLAKQLKPHQLVNHIPGIHFITSKQYMNIQNQDLSYILKSFYFPSMIEEFQDFIKQNTTRKIIVKSTKNRGVKVVDIEDVDYEDKSTFYQEFMNKPFLIDGRFFDLGVFVVITSIDPLRIYRYDHEVLMRFCPEQYHPFDEKNIEKYVIYETHKHFCDMPSLSKYSNNYGFSHQKGFQHYFEQQGHDFKKLQQDIDEAIVELIWRNEHHFIETTSELYNSTRNFFELFRFDFVLDENLKLYLMEVNMSPNLTPRIVNFEKHTQTYEQLIHKTLTLVGAGNRADLMSSYDIKTDEMQSSSKNIAVDPETCTSNNCVDNCDKAECELCQPCLTSEDSLSFHRAYREHMRKGDFKRIFPSKSYFDEDCILSSTPANQIMSKWFKAKCQDNLDWC